MSTSLHTALLQMLSARVASIVMMAAFFAILGRLLTPEDFGYFAITFGAFNLFKTLTAFGLQAYVIRAPEELDRETLARAAGLSLMIAAAACTAMLAAAALFGGWLMPMPMALALVPMAAALLFEPFSLATEARLHRKLSFRLPSRIAALRTAADGCTAIGLALLGWGAPALAVGVLVSHALATVMLLTIGGAQMRVWPRPSLRGLAQFQGVGGRLTAIKLAPDFSDLALISGLGALAGAAPTGLFNRAQLIQRMFDRTLLEGIAPVVLPAISSALTNGTPRNTVYVTKVDFLTAICWPCYALVAVLAEPLVAVLLGDQWDEAVTPVRILAGLGMFLPISKMSLDFFTAIDELPFYLRMQLQSQMVRLGLGFAGAAISLEAFCAAMVAGSGFKAGQIALWTRRNFGPGHYRAIIIRGLLVTLATLCGPAAIVLVGDMRPVLTILCAMPLAGLGWLAGLYLTGHLLYGQMLEAAKDFLQERKAHPEHP